MLSALAHIHAMKKVHGKLRVESFELSDKSLEFQIKLSELKAIFIKDNEEKQIFIEIPTT